MNAASYRRLLAAAAIAAPVLVITPAAMASSLPSVPAPVMSSAATIHAVAAAPGTASPDAGVQQYNQKICGRSWVNVHLAKTSYFNVYNGVFGPGATGCLSSTRYKLDFQVLSSTGAGFHADANISSGWESGRYSCTGHRGACYKYPVRVSGDGDPVSSVKAWLAPGVYDFSYDIWTNRTDAHPVQDDGTEVMIWLAHPGVAEGAVREVRIDGIAWDVTTWMCHRNGATWRLLIYYAVHPRSSASGLRLNDFFREAERHGDMSASYWLTAIDAGFELVRGGVHDNIHYFSLTGLPATPGGK